MSRNPVALRRVADVADVEVTGKEQIGAGGRELRHGHARRAPSSRSSPTPSGRSNG